MACAEMTGGPAHTGRQCMKDMKAHNDYAQMCTNIYVELSPCIYITRRRIQYIRIYIHNYTTMHYNIHFYIRNRHVMCICVPVHECACECCA